MASLKHYNYSPWDEEYVQVKFRDNSYFSDHPDDYSTKRKRKANYSKSRYSGYSCLRYCLCICNILFWVIGAGILGIGIWLRVSYGAYASLIPSVHILSADLLCMVSGGIAFLVAIFGCCGACLHNRGCLVTYFILLILLLGLEVSAGILSFVYRDQVKQVLQTELKDGISKRYGVAGDKGLETAWDYLQIQFECCGLEEKSDWYNITAWPNEEKLPSSCCGSLEPPAQGQECGHGPAKVFDKGCYHMLRSWLVQNLLIAGIILIVFAFIQMFGLTASLLLACTIRNRKR